MSINAATSTSVSNTSSMSGAASNAEVSKKSSSESSFKDEMNKVSTSDKKDEKDEKVEKVEKDKSETMIDKEAPKQETSKDEVVTNNSKNQAAIELEASKFVSMSMIDVNSMLTNDIEQMVNNTNSANFTQLNSLDTANEISKNSSLFTLDFTDNLSVTQSDAEFFLNLTQKNDVSVQNITTQAQTMLNQGANVKEVQQNVRISETLLNAINNARETNQPLRIDFDQNVSVILRIGKDGTIAANFIPGDRAVEQYLKNNIESLKNTFNENDLPYSDLSYSNRGSKQQKERRNNQK